MEKIGLLIDNLGPSQLSYLAIRHAAANKQDDIIFFFDHLEQPLGRLYNASMLMNEIYGYDCKAIATSVDTAEKLISIFGPHEKYFYIWDLEFVSYHKGEPNKNFARYQKIFSSPALKLIARSEEYAQVIEKTFNVSVEYIMKDMNFQIVKRGSNDQTSN